MSTTREIRLSRLLRWREDKLANGHRVTELPSRYDLQLLSTVTDFDESPLLNNEVVRRWKDELFTVWSYVVGAAAEMPADDSSTTTTRPQRTGPTSNGTATSPASPSGRATDPSAAGEAGAASGPTSPRLPAARPEALTDATEEPPADGSRPEPAPSRAGGGEHLFAPCLEPVWSDVEARPIHLANQGSETVLSWEPLASEGYVVYRLSVGRDVFEPTPERGRVVGPLLTPYVRAADVLVATDRPVQWVRVWANTGPDREAAEQSQPRLVAQRGFVTPASEASPWVAGRQMLLRWRIPDGVADVEVRRRRTGAPDDSAVVVQRGVQTKYQEDRHELGSWEYWIYTVADVEGTRPYSPVTVVTVDVTIPLRDVPTLSYERQPDGRFRIEWRQPETGRVTVHVTDRKVAASLQGEVLAETAVTQADPALAPHGTGGVLPHQVRSLDGVEWVEGVALDLDRTGKFLTPVLRRDGEAMVGQSVLVPAVLPLRDLKVHERVDVRLLTFALPSSAMAACVYVTPPGQPLAEGTAHLLEVDAREYWRNGRVVLPDLGSDRPCTIHVRPVFDHHPLRRLGPAVSVDYPGLVTIAYRLMDVPGDGALGERPSQRHRLLQVVNLCSTSVSARFTLCHNPTRLPLSADDGHTVPLSTGGRSSRSVSLPAKVGDEPGQTKSVCWVELPTRGFVRAFVTELTAGSGDMPVALRDPELSMLECPG